MPLVILKIGPEAGNDTYSRPRAEKQRQNLSSDKGEKLDRNSDVALGTILEFVRVFKEASRNFKFLFLFHSKIYILHSKPLFPGVRTCDIKTASNK
jgi:hypothetical protein